VPHPGHSNDGARLYDVLRASVGEGVHVCARGEERGHESDYAPTCELGWMRRNGDGPLMVCTDSASGECTDGHQTTGVEGSASA